MPGTRHALIRYKTIDNCLRNRHKRWTLDLLIEAVSETLYEYEGTDKIISRRTVQADIQMMRSDKLGYNAPIVVQDRKYYTYEDPDYSITRIPLSENDLKQMNEAVEMLSQFKGFSHFSGLGDLVQKLEDHVHSRSEKTRPVIHFERNEQLRGIELLDQLYRFIVQKRAIRITYQSFTARQPNTFDFHGWWLKEYNNRWFLVGVKSLNRPKSIMNLAIDRILEADVSEVAYLENTVLDPDEYYRDVIGASVSEGSRPVPVTVWVAQKHLPYVLTKPLHPSQILVKQLKGGGLIRICVQLNFELEKQLLGFGEAMRVLSPRRLKNTLAKRMKVASDQYDNENFAREMLTMSEEELREQGWLNS